MNLDLARQLAQALADVGVREVCLCAGARNSPLVVLLAEDPWFRKFHFFDERSAAFFALGRMKAHGQPVAVLTTSGTAAAELLPAAIEAHYTCLPLVLVTADRPRRYRATGAPQCIEQVGLFGCYARISIDVEAGTNPGSPFSEAEGWERNGPLHLNPCFEEPLLDRPLGPADRVAPGAPRAATHSAKSGDFEKLDRFLSEARHPLVIVSGLKSHQTESAARFLLQLGAPCFLEGTSGLREDPRLTELSIRSSERILNSPCRIAFDSVVRIGGVPTLRFWRDLETRRAGLKLLSISDCPFPGSIRSELIQAELGAFFKAYRPSAPRDPSEFDDLMALDRRQREAILHLLQEEPASEPALVHALSRLIPAGSGVYLGNSLPIREWDLASTREPRGFRIEANRGANGIDGQLSTFLGFSQAGRENWALVGDLTALYDLSAPWILEQLAQQARELPGLPKPKVRLAVMNNGGGRIFAGMFESPVFQNRHEIGFRSWAEMWGLHHEKWSEVPASWEQPDDAILELAPNADATARFWERFERLWV